jgi:AbrB family looped-hinge helix DNA binding protein
MTGKAKLSSKNQIVIPRAVRQALGLKPGDEVLIEGLGGRAILFKKPRSHTAYLAGLEKDVWKGVDPLEYVKEARHGWKRRSS